VRGVFNLYAGEPNFFNDEELNLLGEMSMDLSFALDYIEKENQRRLTEEALQDSEARYHSLFEHMSEGLAFCRMLYRDGQPEDFIYLDVNKNFEILTGLENVVGKKVSEVIPGIRLSNPELLDTYGRVALTGNPEKLETYLPALEMWFSISVYSPQKEYFVAVFEIITARKKTEEALRKSEQRYRLLAENIKDVIWILDTESFYFTYISPSVQQLRGYSPEEVMAAPVDEAFIPQDRASRKEIIRQAIADILSGKRQANQFEVSEVPQPCKDGSIVWTEVITSYFLNPETGKVELRGVTRDITERKQAEDQIRKLNAELEAHVEERTRELADLYNNAPCGYHSLNENGLYTRVNDTELSWLGYSREDVVGKLKFDDLLTPGCLETFNHNFPIFKKQGWINNLDFEMICRDGSILPVLLSATAVKDPEGRFLMSRSTIIDNSDHKRSEALMREAQLKLENAYNRLEIANQELEAFSYSVSHDLRQPLRAIEGFSAILKTDYTDKLDAEGLQLFAAIQNNTKKMNQLITDLLALSHVTRSEINYMTVNMTALARSVYEEIATRDVKARFKFNLSNLPEAYIDLDLIRQVWVNLLSNAIKYTLPKTECYIDVGSYHEKGRNVYYIRDNGVGFDPEYSQKLFGVFQRLHKASEFEGTGVGLAIVNRIIKRLGGTVWAEGKVDQGATFYFALPELEK
jgi:PAS domain S-box-containing protein